MMLIGVFNLFVLRFYLGIFCAFVNTDPLLQNHQNIASVSFIVVGNGGGFGSPEITYEDVEVRLITIYHICY